MPQRFLRPGITNSERFNACSLHAQSLWLRILTRVDDYGRFDGRPSVLAGELFAIWNEFHPEDAITPQRIPALSCELVRHELADFYEVDGKKIVQLLQWEERVRENAKEKWPANPNPQDSAAEDLIKLPPSPSPSPVPSPTPSPLAVTISKWFRRKPTTQWSVKELRALKEVERMEASADDMNALEAYYTAVMPPDKDYRRRDILTLLNNWPGEMDRATRWQSEHQQRPSKPATAHADVCVIGSSKFTADKPPRREQFKDDSSFEAYNAHYQQWLKNRNTKP